MTQPNEWLYQIEKLRLKLHPQTSTRQSAHAGARPVLGTRYGLPKIAGAARVRVSFTLCSTWARSRDDHFVREGFSGDAIGARVSVPFVA